VEPARGGEGGYINNHNTSNVRLMIITLSIIILIESHNRILMRLQIYTYIEMGYVLVRSRINYTYMYIRFSFRSLKLQLIISTQMARLYNLEFGVCVRVEYAVVVVCVCGCLHTQCYMCTPLPLEYCCVVYRDLYKATNYTLILYTFRTCSEDVREIYSGPSYCYTVRYSYRATVDTR